MKLKSKLIATIVSICAAIAVMGVGVWAASMNFSVTVENTLSMNFNNLNGTVATSVKSKAAAFGASGATGSALTGTAVDLYTGAETADTTAITDFGSGKTAAYADFLTFFKNDNITRHTTHAAVAYYFTYSGASGAVGSVKVSATEGKTPAVTGATVVTGYAVKVGDSGWALINSGDVYFDATAQNVEIVAFMSYENADLSSIAVTGTEWDFTISLNAVAATTATTATHTLSDSIATDGQIVLSAIAQS